MTEKEQSNPLIELGHLQLKLLSETCFFFSGVLSTSLLSLAPAGGLLLRLLSNKETVFLWFRRWIREVGGRQGATVEALWSLPAAESVSTAGSALSNPPRSPS